MRTLAGVIGWLWIAFNGIGVVYELFDLGFSGKWLIMLFALTGAASPGMVLVWWGRRRRA